MCTGMDLTQEESGGGLKGGDRHGSYGLNSRAGSNTDRAVVLLVMLLRLHHILMHGAGGGLYGGYANAQSSTGAGGSGYIGGVPEFTHTNGTTYSPSTTAGQNSGHGHATITFVAF